MNTTSIFFNHSFDKKKLKTFIYWVLKTFGEKDALIIVEELKRMGFYNATKAGLSIGLHDLQTPFKKKLLISHAQIAMNKTDQEFQGAELTATERSQRIIDTWHRTSEDLRKQVVDYFSTYDQLNSVYMMALSGARGNFSQVRQLIGMRGLMADPQGQIISFPIRSNLREGLTLTEYFISCSGARKGLVDTALRTADTGYLTRRLVDISHHIVVKKVTCYTSRGIALKTVRNSHKILLPLKDRLVGRVLGETIYANNENHNQTKLPKLGSLASLNANPEMQNQYVIAQKNQEISLDLALKIALVKERSVISTKSKSGQFFLKADSVLVRSPLTCTYTHELCQLCYGWSMAQGSLVSLGEAVGVIAGQSIGEPGTQLTMRTFHTGGVFSGDLLQEIRAPHSGKIYFPKALQGLLIRTSQGRIAFLIKLSGELLIKSDNISELPFGKTSRLPLEPSTILFVRQGESVKNNQILAELAITTEEGNQPIKSRQTLFSEIGGRIVQWKSMLSRAHKTKGTPKRGELDESPNLPYGSALEFDGVVTSPTIETNVQRQQSIQAYLGPIQGRQKFQYSVFHAFHRSNQALLMERSAQQYEEIWGKINNITVNKIVLSKKHGLGSIEPPKSLKLGLLSVIATQVGASEKTCTQSAISKRATSNLIPRFAKSGRNLSLTNQVTMQLFGFHTHLTCLSHLNTIAEQGDLVDDNYASV